MKQTVSTVGDLRLRPGQSCPGVTRRGFLKESSAILAGAALLGTGGFAGAGETGSTSKLRLPAGLAHLHPSIEHLRRAYESRAAEIFTNLRTTLGDAAARPPIPPRSLACGKTADDPWSTYRYLLGASRHLLDKALANGGDNSVFFRLSVTLRRWKKVAPAPDPHVRTVHQAWQDLQTVYWLDARQVDPKKRTLLFIHGSGIGPFPVFNGLFREFGGDWNIAFFLYDHLEPIAQISERLETCWSRFRNQHGLTGPVDVVSLSYGTTLFRYAVLKNKTGLWQNSTLLEIAPLVLGSRYAKLFTTFPLQKSFLGLAAPNLRHWADGVDGKAKPQGFVWDSDNVTRFDRVVPRRLSLVPERDMHLSSQARHQLVSLLGEGKLSVIKGATHDPAPGYPQVIAQARKFLRQGAAGQP